MTQGEVVSFAAGAAAKMRADGCNVLVEGREQTLDHVRACMCTACACALRACALRVHVHCVCMWHVACGTWRARSTACTLQVRTQHRFELTLSEPLLIGMRRAAQRMLGAAQKRVAAGEKPDDVTPMLAEELAKISQA